MTLNGHAASLWKFAEECVRTESKPCLCSEAPGRRGTVEAFAAGVILALVSETMIPEAFRGSPQFNGLLLVVGFVALLILLVLSH